MFVNDFVQSLEREVAASKASLEQAEQRLQTSDSKLAEAQSVQERLWKSNTEGSNMPGIIFAFIIIKPLLSPNSKICTQ